MGKVHELKIITKYFEAVEEGVKTFEIRKNDRGFEVGDYLLLKDFKDGEFTGNEILQRIAFITEYEQKEGFVVMSICRLPKSFRKYLVMSEKEKTVFEKIISHIQLYGYGVREVSNTLAETLDVLLEDCELSESDHKWYREFFAED